MSGSEDWGQSEWADLVAQPEALACALEELGDEDRRTALRTAFPKYWESEAPGDSFQARHDALGDYAVAVSDAEGQDAALDGAQVLVESLEWEEGADADGAVLTVVVAVLAEQGELPGLPAYLRVNNFEAEPYGHYTYGTKLLNATGPAGERVRDVYHGMTESFDASSLVP